MNHNYNFKLIDGTFNPSEASLILFNLISSKIDFHTLENFSSQERFGKESPESQNRIRALKEVREDLKRIFNVAEKEELTFKIESFVKINIEKQTDL